MKVINKQLYNLCNVYLHLLLFLLLTKIMKPNYVQTKIFALSEQKMQHIILNSKIYCNEFI